MTAARTAMLFKRVIPCLDVRDGRVVKGVNFVDFRDAGDPVELAAFYDAEGADEIVFLDITASHERREIIAGLAARCAEQVFIPFTVGGGLRTVDDIRQVLKAGADKASIMTAGIENPAIITEGAERFGRQCIVVAIDANCLAFSAARKSVVAAVRPEFESICVPACPDPHIERWYLADPQAFARVVGGTPTVPKHKCERDVYKQALAQAVTEAGHPRGLDGIEFGPELAEEIDLYRAACSESSLKHFIEDLTGKLKRL